MDGVAIFTEEQINRLVEAAVGRAVDMLTKEGVEKVKEPEQYITTKEAMELLKIKSTKGFIAFRRKHKIRPIISGRPNIFEKSDFYGFKK